jgi:NitT/TauT family transport system permease protein
MIRREIPMWLFLALAIGGIVVLLVSYELLSARQTRINPKQTTIPSFAKLSEGLQKIFQPQGTEENPKPPMFWNDMRATLWRLMVGLGIGVSASIAIGVLMGAYRWIEAPLSPIVMFLSKIPPTAMMPIYFAVAGTDQRMFTSMVALGIFFSMAQSIYQAVRDNVSDESINKAYTLGASEMEVIYEVIWKQILPNVIDCVRMQIGPAMIFLIAAEMVVSDAGLGYQIRMQSRVLNMNIVFVYLVILGIIGLIAEFGLVRLRRWLCPWFEEGAR